MVLLSRKSGNQLLFTNKCPLCGSSNGTLSYQFVDPPPSRGPNMDHKTYLPMNMLRTVHYFKCIDCGALTMIEQRPIVVVVLQHGEYQEGNDE